MATATIARPTGETLRGKQKEKDVRMSNIIAAKGGALTRSGGRDTGPSV